MFWYPNNSANALGFAFQCSRCSALSLDPRTEHLRSVCWQKHILTNDPWEITLQTNSPYNSPHKQTATKLNKKLMKAITPFLSNDFEQSPLKTLDLNAFPAWLSLACGKLDRVASGWQGNWTAKRRYNFPNRDGNQAVNLHLILPVCTIYIITANLGGSLREPHSSLWLKIRQCLLLATLVTLLSRQMKEDIISSTTVAIDGRVAVDFLVLCDSTEPPRLWT